MNHKLVGPIAKVLEEDSSAFPRLGATVQVCVEWVEERLKEYFVRDANWFEGDYCGINLHWRQCEALLSVSHRNNCMRTKAYLCPDTS